MLSTLTIVDLLLHSAKKRLNERGDLGQTESAMPYQRRYMTNLLQKLLKLIFKYGSNTAFLYRQIFTLLINVTLIKITATRKNYE